MITLTTSGSSVMEIHYEIFVHTDNMNCVKEIEKMIAEFDCAVREKAHQLGGCNGPTETESSN